MEGFFIICALILILFIIWAFFRIVFDILKYVFGFSINPAKRKLAPSHLSLLEKYFLYYQKLNHRDKSKFQKRLRYFIDSKIFLPKQMSKITDEMRILIGACAVQLTFGLPPIRLVFFKQILVYPDKYTSINGKVHKGEVNMKRHLIVLSWKDFVEGYRHIPWDLA